MLSALRRLYTGIYFIHDKGLPVINLVFWLYVQVQRYLLLPFSSISPATSVFSVFPLPAPCAPIATCSSPLLRVRVIRASMLLTLTLATQLCVYQSSACSHDYTRALFLLFFYFMDPIWYSSTRIQQIRPGPRRARQALQEGRRSDLFPIPILIKALPLRISMSCQLVVYYQSLIPVISTVR